MMKVIFLDVDGVLNNRYSMSKKFDTIYKVHKPCVARLNRLCVRTGAVCVLSSTWRLYWPIVAFQQFLEKNGFTGLVVDRTDDLQGCMRGIEIGKYIAQCRVRDFPIESFVILDDDNDMGELDTYLVQTKTEIGLDQDCVERAIEILGEV